MFFDIYTFFIVLHLDQRDCRIIEIWGITYADRNYAAYSLTTVGIFQVVTLVTFFRRMQL